MAAVFIPQPVLDQWADQGKVALKDTTLHLLKENRTVDLNPAVRFTSLVGAEDDPNQLIGKVKTADQLAGLGAEHYMDSVILGDVAYQVVEGFMGDLSRPSAATPATKPAAPAPVEIQAKAREADREADTVVDEATHPATEPVPPPSGSEDSETEAEALSKLFLDTVS